MSEGKLENINLESNEKNNDKYINNKLKSKALNFKQNEIVSDNNKIDERKNLYNKIFKKEITSFHLDDLVVLDEKLKNIILILNKIKPAYFACFDFLLYFKGNCDIFKNMNLLIKNEYDLKIIQNGINYILISIIFTFDYSYKQGILNNIILYMKEMINLAYQNLILIFDYFLKKTSISEIKSLWSVKLQNIIKLALDKTDKDQNLNLDYFLTSENNKENKTNIETIKNNTNFILQSIKIIIKNYKNRNSNIILLFLKEIYQKTSFKDIFYFFQNKILHSNGLFNYLSTNLVLRQNPNLFKDIIPPYIKSFSKKKFSLILGLEGTLIYSKFDSNNSYYINKISSINNIIELRPGLIHFLSEMKKYFELIIFSLFTQKIADYIINFIEKKEKYFEYRLYVQHATIIENEFIKEIKRIGRPIDKIIIVDNFSQNYKTNKKNAINIKSYFEKNCNDSTLIELEKILPKIINNGNDVRNGIEKYRNEIIGKVSSNIDI
jgi:Dullard-like phosphatase family protein